jgi:type III secretory pathway component EscV
MEIEDEDAVLQRLFFKKYGCALPEVRVRNEVDEINFVIDLTEDEEMEASVAAPVVVPLPIAAVKTEPIEAAEASEINADMDVSNVTNVAKRHSSRLERLELAKARKAITEFGKSLRKTDVILEKEAPHAASSNIIATDDTDMAEANSVTTNNAVKTTEQVIAESDAAIKACEELVALYN